MFTGIPKFEVVLNIPDTDISASLSAYSIEEAYAIANEIEKDLGQKISFKLKNYNEGIEVHHGNNEIAPLSWPMGL